MNGVHFDQLVRNHLSSIEVHGSAEITLLLHFHLLDLHGKCDCRRAPAQQQKVMTQNQPQSQTQKLCVDRLQSCGSSGFRISSPQQVGNRVKDN